MDPIFLGREDQHHSFQKSMVLLQIMMEREDLHLADLEDKKDLFLHYFLHNMDHLLFLVIIGALHLPILVVQEECRHLSLKIVGNLTWNKETSQIPNIMK